MATCIPSTGELIRFRTAICAGYVHDEFTSLIVRNYCGRRLFAGRALRKGLLRLALRRAPDRSTWRRLC